MTPLEREVIGTIAAETGLDANDLRPETKFYDLGVDSLSALEIIAVLEEKYNIVLDGQELRDTGTIGAVVNNVSSKIREKEART